MIILIKGIPDCGKSAFAEQLVLDACYKSNGKNSNESNEENAGKSICESTAGNIGMTDRLYIATMVPYGEEGRQRVLKHRAMRDGKGFITLECPERLDDIIPEVEKHKSPICLLECISNLCGNVMHMDEYKDKPEDELCELITESVLRLSESCRELYAVTNEFEQIESNYDDETVRYIRLTHKVNMALTEIADKLYEYGNGGFVIK